MKFRVTETKTYIIEAENGNEALEIYSELIHGNVTVCVEDIDIEDEDYIRKTLNI